MGRFLFVSFRRTPGISFPLGEAKAQVERAISGLDFTIIQASWFMEVWLSPALGFDYANAAARIFIGIEPYQLGFFPRRRRDLHDCTSISGGQPEDN